MTAKLEIIIVTYRDRDNLGRCLESVFQTTTGVDAHVTVFDNDSRDGSAELVRSGFPQAELVESSTNVGLVKALNACIARTSSDYVMTLDSDTIVRADAIASLVAFLGQHPEVGVVGARLYYLDGSLQATARADPTVLNAFFGRQSVLTRLFPTNPLSRRYLQSQLADRQEWFETDWVSAAGMLIKRKALHAVGGFDEDFFVYWCDADLCFRIRRAGYHVACLPAARITHCEQFRRGRKKSTRMIVDFHKGVYYFYTKNYTRSALNPMRLVALAGLSARAGLLLAVNRFLK